MVCLVVEVGEGGNLQQSTPSHPILNGFHTFRTICTQMITQKNLTICRQTGFSSVYTQGQHSSACLVRQVTSNHWSTWMIIEKMSMHMHIIGLIMSLFMLQECGLSSPQNSINYSKEPLALSWKSYSFDCELAHRFSQGPYSVEHEVTARVA